MTSGRARARRVTSAFALSVSIASVAVSSGIGTSRVAFAQTKTDDSSKAARAFADGQAAYEARDYRRAAQLFETAYAAKPHPAALFNAARSWQHAGEDVLCANALERYLHDSPNEVANRDDVSAIMADVMKRVARVQIRTASPTITKVQVDGTPRTEPEGTAYVLPGDHAVTAEDAQGNAIKKPFSVHRGDTIVVTLTASPSSSAPAVVPAPTVTPDTKAVPPDTVEPPPEASSHGARVLSPWWVVVGGALTAGGAGVTVWSGVDTITKRNAFIAQQNQARLTDGFNAQQRTNILLGGTIGVAALTALVAILFVDWKGGGSDHAPDAKSSAK